jgi:hypothetical protein
MPMRLCGAPSTFQYRMDDVFRKDLHVGGSAVPYWQFIAVYLDDICIFSSSLEEHVAQLRAVLQRLREHKLYVKPTKCAWGQSEIEFLGHFVSASDMRANPERSKALQDWPVPKSVHDMRSLLGTFNYWRGYIRGFSDIVSPLVALTRKDIVWRWRDAVEGHALRTLKQALLDSPVLIAPNPEKPYYVVTDASDCAVGASLEQEEGGGRESAQAGGFLFSFNESS